MIQEDKGSYLTFRLPTDLREQLQVLARAREQSLGGLLRVIAKEFTESQKHAETNFK